MFEKNEIRLVIYSIIASAYMIITYDIIQALMQDPINYNIIPIKATAGLISAGIGAGVIFMLTKR